MATDDKYIAYRFRIYPDKEQRIYFGDTPGKSGCKSRGGQVFQTVCHSEV